MSVNYKVVAKRNPSNREADPKYYASANAKGKRNQRFIAKQIAERSSLNEMDILSVIEGFLQIVPECLADGYSVGLGDFGSFSITAKSEPADTAEEFNASLIEGVKPNFRPGKLFKKELGQLEYKKISE
ncbi:HU family DNA-binding protein [Carboxylicivirga marina]|uniref:HU family DNA-binding protein n=1 Tax=Carboxylicivirga marina TaxID=2800988 RepID=UPI00259247FD|nr:HU family DNA-binding protein [uncultured Carboxylicivirga sp.]